MACGGKRLSKQTYELIAKIREIDECLERSRHMRDVVWEVHPELSFRYWNRSKAMQHPKKSGFGFLERYKLVVQSYGDTAARIRAAIPRKKATDDDILDALAALWTAERIHAGTAIQLPSTAEYDERGLPMHACVEPDRALLA